MDSPQSQLVKALVGRLQACQRLTDPIFQKWVKPGVEEDAQQIFRKAGFPVWLAMVAAVRDATNSDHFSGKRDLQKQVGDIRNQTSGECQRLAQLVGTAITADASLQLHANNLEQKLQKRLSLSESSSRKRRRMSPRMDPDSPNASTTSGTTFRPESAVQPAHSSSGYRHQDPAACDALDNIEPEHTFVNVPLDNMKCLFPVYLSSATERILDPVDNSTYVAAISMSFPDNPFTTRYGCHMTIHITPYKIQEIAKTLFGVSVETKEGLRYLITPDGVEMVPSPKLTIQGCRFDALDEFFWFTGI